jgi:DNA-binding response OmpR family regulator
VIILSARVWSTTGSPVLRRAPTTTCPSRSRRPSWSFRVQRILERGGGEGGGGTDREPIRHGDLVLDRDRHEVRIGDRLVALTAVEFRLLATLLEADGRVLTRDQLLDAVYGQDESEILDRTVDVHIGRLRDKLGDDAEAPRYVATVRGVGYRAAPVGAEGGVQR